MKAQELIESALLSASTDSVTLYWDYSAGEDEGPAFRFSDEDKTSGPLDFQGWLRDGKKVEGEEAAGYTVGAFFRGHDGAYLGPDEDGIYPALVA